MRNVDRNLPRLSSGTVVMRNTPGGRRFAKAWKDAEPLCRRFVRDEDVVQRISPKLAGISIALLPTIRSKIFDEPEGETAIEHLQASRMQFKPSYTLRRVGRPVLTIAAIANFLVADWWLTRRAIR